MSRPRVGRLALFYFSPMPMSSPAAKIAASVIVAVGAVGLLFLWGGVSLDEVGKALRSISPAAFALGLGIQAMIYVFRAVRLKGLLRASGAEEIPGIPSLTAASAAWILDSNLLPAKAGEAMLVLHLRRLGVTAEYGLTGLLLSRLFDLATLISVLGVTCLALATAGQRPGLDWLAPLGAALLVGALCVFGAILKGGEAFGLVRRLLVRLGLEKTLVGQRISGFASKVEAALRSVPRSALIPAFFWSLPAWAAVLGVYVVFGRGVGLADLGLYDMVFGASLAILGSSVPITGLLGFGMLDMAWAFGFEAMGVPRADAVATGLAFHTLYLVGVGILGAIGHAAVVAIRR